jgi:hypothetical protein
MIAQSLCDKKSSVGQALDVMRAALPESPRITR